METSPRFFNEKTHFQRLCLFSRCLYTPLSLSLYFSFSLIFLFAEASLEKKPNRFHGNDLALRYSINEPLFSGKGVEVGHGRKATVRLQFISIIDAREYIKARDI